MYEDSLLWHRSHLILTSAENRGVICFTGAPHSSLLVTRQQAASAATVPARQHWRHSILCTNAWKMASNRVWNTRFRFSALVTSETCHLPCSYSFTWHKSHLRWSKHLLLFTNLISRVLSSTHWKCKKCMFAKKGNQSHQSMSDCTKTNNRVCVCACVCALSSPWTVVRQCFDEGF